MSTPDKLIEALEQLRRKHDTCEDCWYSCPKSGECCDDRQDECNCGADYHNQKLDEILLIARSLLSELTELREYKEALDWLVYYYGMRLLGPENVPPLIKHLIAQKEQST